MSNKLKRCPFCGSQPTFHSGENDYGRVSIYCQCRIHPAYTQYLPDLEAIEIWNTRQIEDAQFQEIERLRAENARLLQALEDMVWQHCRIGELYVTHDFMSANEYAIELLEDLNKLEHIGYEKYRKPEKTNE